jgi:hypothetical protein
MSNTENTPALPGKEVFLNLEKYCTAICNVQTSCRVKIKALVALDFELRWLQFARGSTFFCSAHANPRFLHFFWSPQLIHYMWSMYRLLYLVLFRFYPFSLYLVKKLLKNPTIYCLRSPKHGCCCGVLTTDRWRWRLIFHVQVLTMFERN